MSITRKAVMEDPAVHFLTKDIIRMAEGKDPVDAYYDVLLAAKVLKAELDTLQPLG